MLYLGVLRDTRPMEAGPGDAADGGSALQHTPAWRGLPIHAADHGHSVRTRGLLELDLVVPVTVAPHEPAGRRREGGVVRVELRKGPHLAVQVGISEQQLLAVQPAEVGLVPIQAEGPLGSAHQTPLVAGELLKKGRLQVHVWPAEAQELHRLPKAPAVLLHHVGGEHAARSRLPPYRVDEHALRRAKSLLHKPKYLVRHDVPLVENHLVIGIDPVVGQVRDSDRLPVVGYLSPAAVDDPGHLVRNHELQVLRRQLVADEQAILHLNGTQDLVAQAGSHPADRARRPLQGARACAVGGGEC
mmetsp:Transcript_51178/g.147715  ORF Transcript_51178/g.147715 Transcript_51178/m.147715 type:complete len:301 (-) Transcript_51178:36-938(-)